MPSAAAAAAAAAGLTTPTRFAGKVDNWSPKRSISIANIGECACLLRDGCTRALPHCGSSRVKYYDRETGRERGRDAISMDAHIIGRGAWKG